MSDSPRSAEHTAESGGSISPPSSMHHEPAATRHLLTRRDLINSAGVAAIGLSAATIVGSASTRTFAQPAEPRQDTEREFPDGATMQRVDELLRRMTVEEKAMQLSCVVPIAVLGRQGLMRGQADALLKQGMGHIAGPGLIGHKRPGPDRAQEARAAREERQRHPALPGHRDAPHQRRRARISLGRNGGGIGLSPRRAGCVFPMR